MINTKIARSEQKRSEKSNAKEPETKSAQSTTKPSTLTALMASVKRKATELDGGKAAKRRASRK